MSENVSKRISKTERYRRVINAAYKRMVLAMHDPVNRSVDILNDLELLDAMKDCCEDGDFNEWTISREGKIEFR